MRNVSRRTFGKIRGGVMKSKQVLSIDQMKHLQELGLELRNTSTLLWYKQMLGKIPISDWELSVWSENLFCEEYVYPAYTLQDIIDKLPPIIYEVYWLIIEIMDRQKNEWKIKYARTNGEHECVSFMSENLIDAAYEMLCWVIEKRYITKEE